MKIMTLAAAAVLSAGFTVALAPAAQADVCYTMFATPEGQKMCEDWFAQMPGGPGGCKNPPTPEAAASCEQMALAMRAAFCAQEGRAQVKDILGCDPVTP